MKKAIPIFLLLVMLTAHAVPALAADGQITMDDVTALFHRVISGDNTVTLKDVTRQYQQMKAQHQHTFIPRVVKEPSCTEPGETRYECSCGESYSEYPEATGHSWGPWEDETPATCTDKGRQKQTCNNCHTVQYQDVQAKGHSWNGNHTCDNCGILNIAEAEAAIDDYARNLDRDPKITIDSSIIGTGGFMFAATTFSASEYLRIVEEGKGCVDDIIIRAESSGRFYVKSVKAVVSVENSAYSVRVYYQFGQNW